MSNSSEKKMALLPEDDDLEFTMDFGNHTPEIPDLPSTMDESENSANKESSSKKELLEIPNFDKRDFTNKLDSMFDEDIENSINNNADETQKTILYKIPEMESNEFELTRTSSSAELMSLRETKENIETTIKSILSIQNPNKTQEIKPLFTGETDDDFASFSLGTQEGEEVFSEKADGAFEVEKITLTDSVSDEFDLNSVAFTNNESQDEFVDVKPQIINHQPAYQSEIDRTSIAANTNYLGKEDSTHIQATIRLLREERDEILGQIKILKNENKQLEQDNLTLITALDESKIEISILRKRHLIELEDMKYQFALNEEKKAMALEKARQEESKREKLEQRVRIDFNQVKQREKELETKLEMLAMDVDSQVQSRDHKILELRRKIDSLEFNMENVSIKEHKSQEDKRKLEDKLNKIMKTLRHSIKNLEDDIDQSADSSQDDRQNLNNRTGKI